MKKEKYIENIFSTWITEVESIVLDSNKLNPKEYLQYSICKANLNHFLEGDIDNGVDNFFKEVLFYDKWTNVDMTSPFSSARLSVSDSDAHLKKKIPQLFCTIQMGAHFLMVKHLWSAGVNFALVTNSEVQAKEMDQAFAIWAKAHKAAYFKTITLSDTTNIERLAAEINKGHSLLFYTDQQIQAKESTVKNIDCDFFDKQIKTSDVIPNLAKTYNLPIIPIISYRTNGQKFKIKILPQIITTKRRNYENYASESMNTLFRIFERYVNKYPTEWNGWLKPYTLFQTNQNNTNINHTLEETTSMKFNRNQFVLYENKTTLFILDILGYNAFKISRPLYKIFNILNDSKAKFGILNALLPNSLLQTLISKKVIIPTNI